MARLSCDACGSTEMVKNADNYFECQFCGAKYTPEAVKMMIQGTVEVVVGKEELNRTLEKAKTFSQMGGMENRQKSLENLQHAKDEFPSYVETWTTYLELQFAWYTGIKSIPTKRECYDIDKALDALHYLDAELAQQYREKLHAFWDNAAAGFREGGWWLSSDLASQDGVPSSDAALHIYQLQNSFTTPAFAQVIKEAEERGRFLQKANYAYDWEEWEWGVVRSYGARYVSLLLKNCALVADDESGITRSVYVTDVDQIMEKARAIVIAENEAAQKKAAMMKDSRYCRHCDKLSGRKQLLGIKCSICGRKL